MIIFMYKPAGYQSPSFAFLWPALAAASAGEMAAFIANQFTQLAVGGDSAAAPEPQWATPNTVALALDTVRLRDFTAGTGGTPALLCAPFALHSAVLSDLAPGHSLVEALREAGLRRLFVTDWGSATATMRFLGIDDYLAALNVVVDEIGPPLDLIGMCQGGWMALIYAARFPGKVRKLVLAGAPVDPQAAPSALSELASASSLAVFHELVRLGGGLVPGRKVLKFWGPEAVEAENIRQILNTEEPIGSPAFARLEAAFRSWHAWTVDLPGKYFLETVEKLYLGNELARGNFTALGRRIDLKAVTAPIFLLAARDDELVAPPQLFAAERLVGTPPHLIGKDIAACRHVGLFTGKTVLKEFWPRIVRWMMVTPSLPERMPNKALELAS